MHDWLQRIWYGGVAAPWWLRALSAVYGAASAVRRNCYRRGWCRRQAVGAPVIVVGNITVGGTGKTPLVIWLCDALGGLGLRVAVITRGYGGKPVGASAARGGVVRVTDASDTALVGDEALLIHRRAHVPIYVGRDRVAAGLAAVAQGAQVVVSDDGLQHLRLQRDVDIAVIDAERGLGNGALLPAGPLREGPSRLKGVAAVVLTGAGNEPYAADEPYEGALRMTLRGDQLLPVNPRLSGPGVDVPRPLASLRAQRVVAYAAIGNPERFFRTLRAAGLEVEARPLPDHQPITGTQLRDAGSMPVLMTEKDAVKCASWAPANCWYLPVSASFEPAAAHALLRRILMDARLLDILACPVCKGPLRLARDSSGDTLVCRADRLGFPVRDGIPVMLEEEARVLEAGDPLLER